MGDQRYGGIAWTDQTWNPVRGCSRVSEGCRNCYAERMAARFSGPGGVYEGLVRATSDGPRWTGEVRLVPERLGDPLRWKRPRRVFVNSMSDLFHESLPFEHIAAIFGVMAAAPQHTFQVLTKRPERAAEFFAWAAQQTYGDLPHGHNPSAYADPLSALARALSECPAPLPGLDNEADEGDALARALDVPWPLRNVGIGASVEDQKTADARTPLLLRLPAAWRFISYEPALGPVRWDNGESSWMSCDGKRPEPEVDCCESFAVHGHHFRGIDWIIVGGESGPGARPFDIAWARQTIAQCREAGVPVFVKQMGARVTGRDCEHGRDSDPCRFVDRAGANPAEWPADLRVREFPEVRRG